MDKKDRQKRILLELMEDKTYIPMKIKELAVILNVPKERRDELEGCLQELLDEGKISLSKRGKYSLPKEQRYIGVFTGHERGFGFVMTESGEEFYISPSNVNSALHLDTVEITSLTEKTGRRKEAVITRIISHEIKDVVGTYQKSKNFGYVVPDNNRITADIYIPKGKGMEAVNGSKVVCQILSYASKDRSPEGFITEVLGHKNEPGVDILSVVKAMKIPSEFSEEVLKEAKSVLEITKEDKKDRLDLRNELTVTIDGDDAKDLDDAVTLNKNDNGYTLGVHIADVSNYVKEGSALDKEALNRGTSVYLCDRVIPMLPKELSNGICSLNQGEDRLALSCIMEIDSKGNIKDHKIAKTLIRVDKRMSYSMVDRVLKGDEEAKKDYSGFIEMIGCMYELSSILRKKRKKRGAVDFDLPECKIELDDRGKVLNIKPYDRNDATKIIEDFMLAANETVAERFFWQEIPFVYRNHDKPDEDKMKQLAAFVGGFGYSIRRNNTDHLSKELQSLLEKAKGKPEERLLFEVVLRSMKRAVYNDSCNGHFGLAATYYTHFTSPIRRYPDLQIHRIIKEMIEGKLDEKRIAHYKKILPSVSENSSVCERRAFDAEMKVEKLKKIEYIRNYIGEEFEGIISGVTSYGFYVELPNTVEGMVGVDSLKGDYYAFDEKAYALKGEMTHREFRLGQQVRIRVEDADKVTERVDFVLC